MREMKRIVLGLSLIMAVLFAGCSSDDDPVVEQGKEEASYSVTYSVTELTQDFFACGSFLVTYADAQGKMQTVKLEKKSQVPFTIKLEGLKPDSKLYFDLSYGIFDPLNLTEDAYTFGMNASYAVTGTDKSQKIGTIATGSMSMAKDKVKVYLDNLTKKESTLDTTVKGL